MVIHFKSLDESRRRETQTLIQTMGCHGMLNSSSIEISH